jgi:hypothetical protein
MTEEKALEIIERQMIKYSQKKKLLTQKRV